VDIDSSSGIGLAFGGQGDNDVPAVEDKEECLSMSV
jgi:hypothetical protein